MKTISVAVPDAAASAALVPGAIPPDTPQYDVRIGRDLLGSVARAAAAYSRALLVSDANVAPLYAERTGLDGISRCIVAPGEGSKSFATLELVVDAAARAGLDRYSAIVALGGGVVGDLGGLAAALYMRGIACIQVPTTLLAQVDSSVGGKTAINLHAGKNLAGTFHPPALVIADTGALATLSDDEYRSGIGEIVKTALVDGQEALLELERDAAGIVRRDPDLLAEVVARSVATKAAVVARDPRESGERKVLNLGHTFAHAIERTAGYGRVPHGVAVAVGVVLAVRASRSLGLLEERGLGARIGHLLCVFGLPADLAELRAAYKIGLPAKELADAMRLDKKSRAGRVRLVLPIRAGRLELDVEADAAQLEAWLA